LDLQARYADGVPVNVGFSFGIDFK
jgi:hypothetical protein